MITDFDPEEDAPPPDSDEDSDVAEEDNNAGREHYVDVGKSKLRKRDIVPLGPRYEGSRISRDAIADDEDDDDPFSKGFDEEDSEKEDAEDAEEDGVSGEEDDSEDGDEDLEDGDSPATDLSDEDNDEAEDEEDDDGMDGIEDDTDDRAELRRMMAEEQKSVAATLSQAAKSDAEKGRAVKKQRTAFDSLLNTRIKLQKALVGVNTLGELSQEVDDMSVKPPVDAFHAAETAAFTLWSSLNELRETLDSSRTGNKRKRSDYTVDSSTDDLWAHMQAQEDSSRPYRNTVLEKWSAKARGATAIAPRSRLNNTASQQTIVSVLQEQLSSSDRLVKRARTPRSCAPLQLSRKITESENIYDDADFYGVLLQSLLEQRNADSVAASASASNIDVSFQMRREAKTKKNVDTKASKGRKLRYTVHEKLQNFMAPEHRGAWGERQSDELFGSLFGRKMGLGEEEEEEPTDNVDEEMQEAGLMLFRS